MKNRVYALLMALVFSLAAADVSQAMSELVSLSLAPEWPATTEPGTVVLYKVYVVRDGQGFLDVSLSSAGLPEGTTVTFEPNTLRFVGRRPEVQTALMT